MPDFTVETTSNQPIEIVEQKLIINEIAGNVVQVDEENLTVSLGSSSLGLIIVGQQGPPGPPGQSGASGTLTYKVEANNYFITFPSDSNSMLGVDCTNGNILITLPVSTTFNQGNNVIIKKIDNTSHIVTVMTSNGQVMDNVGSSMIIARTGESYMYVSSGSGYEIN